MHLDKMNNIMKILTNNLLTPLQNIIKRQRQAIEKIKKENERLKEQLAAESQSTMQNDSSSISLISQMQEHCEQYQVWIRMNPPTPILSRIVHASTCPS